MMVAFRGGHIPVSALMRALDSAWDAKLTKLQFRVWNLKHAHNSDPVDESVGITNKEIYGILRMPHVGRRISYSESSEIRCAECFGGSDLLSFESYEMDIVTWAKSRGYYIEFEDGELEILDRACRAA